MNGKPYIYIGPSLSRGRLNHAQVFINGFPPHIRELMDRYPCLAKLMAPAAETATALRLIKQSGTPLHKYAAMAKNLKED